MDVKSTRKNDLATAAQLAVSNRTSTGKPMKSSGKEAMTSSGTAVGFQQTPAQLAKMSADGKVQVRLDNDIASGKHASPAAVAKLNRDTASLHEVFNKQAENALKTAKPGAEAKLWQDAITTNNAVITAAKAKDNSPLQSVALVAAAEAQVKVVVDRQNLVKNPSKTEQDSFKAELRGAMNNVADNRKNFIDRLSSSELAQGKAQFAAINPGTIKKDIQKSSDVVRNSIGEGLSFAGKSGQKVDNQVPVDKVPDLIKSVVGSYIKTTK